jgi:hypothetical protein
MEKTQKLISIISTVLQEAKQAGLIRPELDSFQLTVVFWAASNGVIAFMDQVTSEPGLVFAKAVAKRPELSVLNLFTQLDHEKSLHTLWDLIGQAIKP